KPLSVYPRSSRSPRRFREDFGWTQVERSRGRVRGGPYGDSILRRRFARHPAGLHTSPDSRRVAFRRLLSEGFCRMPRLLNRDFVSASIPQRQARDTTPGSAAEQVDIGIALSMAGSLGRSTRRPGWRHGSTLRRTWSLSHGLRSYVPLAAVDLPETVVDIVETAVCVL